MKEAIGAVVIAFAVVIGLAFLMVLPTMWLWNWLMPDIFGLQEITFWQALGINFLTGILFRTNSSSKD